MSGAALDGQERDAREEREELRRLAHHARTSPVHRRELVRVLRRRVQRAAGWDAGPAGGPALLLGGLPARAARVVPDDRVDAVARRLVHARGQRARAALRRLLLGRPAGAAPHAVALLAAAEGAPAPLATAGNPSGRPAGPRDVDVLLAAGRPGRARALAVELLAAGSEDALLRRLVRRPPDDDEVLADGLPLPARRAPVRRAAAGPRATPVRYLLHNSLPARSGGYATRSHALLRALRADGWQVEALTRPGFDGGPETVVDGVPYGRLATPGDVPTVPVARYVAAYAAALEQRARRDEVGLLHAASNSWNGLAALTAGARLGLPVVYEVRGLWELTRLSREPAFARTRAYRLQRALEVQAASAADHTFVLTEALRRELVAAGVPEERTSVLPNGVDPDRFVPQGRDAALDAALGTRGRTVVGYVGSVVDYEGLELLVDAAVAVRAAGRDLVVLIVGDGAALPGLRARVAAAGAEDVVRFTGRVPHDEVERYYSLVDVAAFPRRPWPVCELVSPLKPFEAMAAGKAVVASGVAALREVVDDGTTGLVHEPDDVGSLADCLTRLVDDPALRRRLADAGRAWVRAERDWRVLVTRVTSVYEQLLERPAGGTGAPA